jgi:hypothetical protein
VPGPDKAALMRSVNEGIAFFASDLEPGEPGVPDRWSFVCECGARECCAWVDLDLAAYTAVRGQQDGAVLAGGHVPACEPAEPETAAAAI